MFSKLERVHQRIAREGIAPLPRWFGDWMFWNAGLYRLVPDWLIEDWRDNAKYARSPKKYNLNDPIIVYQMGKVGSRTVHASLEALNLDVPVYHLHFLNNIKRSEQWVKDVYPPGKAYPMLRVAKKIRADMQKNPNKRWNLISIVRAPVPHEISVYFHLLELHFPDFEKRQVEDPVFPRTVVENFIKHEIDDTPTSWFDEQVKQLFGIDVYASPFPWERGYQTYEKENIRLLVMRLEDMDRVLVPAVTEFLGIPAFEIIRTNISQDKSYGKLYRDALPLLRLSPEYLARKHSTQYARHFYAPEELAASVARWT